MGAGFTQINQDNLNGDFQEFERFAGYFRYSQINEVCCIARNIGIDLGELEIDNVLSPQQSTQVSENLNELIRFEHSGIDKILSAQQLDSLEDLCDFLLQTADKNLYIWCH